MTMWKPLIGIAAAALVLGLAGCTSGAPSAPDTSPETAESGPLTAEKPAAETTEGTPEEQYLEHMRARIKEDRPPDLATQIPNATDQQLLDAAADACEQLAAGVELTHVQVVEGEAANQTGYFVDSLDIANAAVEFICTDVG